jgi:putative glycosyltransferase (TIGR04372 family)
VNYHVVDAGGWQALVVRPREGSYGHQVVEIAMALHLGRHLGMPVAVQRPARPANSALYDIECEEVPLLAGWRGRAALWLGRRAERRAERALDAQRESAARAGRKFKPGPPDLQGMDFRDCYAHVPLTVRLRQPARAAAAAAAAALGIGPDARIVTVHARESGFKDVDGQDSAVDAIRNARIDTYLPACELLSERGYTVVRIGDPAMTPVRHPAVVDLATSPHRTDALELDCLLRARLQIACDSGPFCVSYLSQSPCLAVNVTNLVGAYPLRSGDRYVLKHVVDVETGRRLVLRDLVEPDYFENRKDLARFAFEDNSPGEIRAAVEEMLAIVDGETAPPEPAQLEYRDLVATLWYSDAVSRRRVRKGEPAAQVLGDGFVGRAFARAQLDGAGLN